MPDIRPELIEKAKSAAVAALEEFHECAPTEDGYCMTHRMSYYDSDCEEVGIWVDESAPAVLSAAADDLRAEGAAGALRDEYHTLDELYEYRMLYNALAANAMPGRAVKSWRHDDGEECFGGGWFVVYLTLPSGQVSNHYKAEHWDLFQVPEADLAPAWDGHTPAVTAQRLYEAVRADQIAGADQ